MCASLSIERRGAAAVFTINRPSQANAMTRQVLVGLGRFAREQGHEDDVRVLVVTGAGERHFCAGADLKERAGWTEDDVREQLRLYRTELGALDACPKPVVAAINGLALGGGLEIAMACDLRVAVSHARMGQPEVGLGIIPGAGGTQRLPVIVGEARAKEMILLGRSLTSEQAMAWGLIHRVTAPGADLMDDVLAWIEPMLGGAPLALRSALEAIDAARSGDLQSGLEAERVAYERVLASEDRLEGLASFADKRQPRYQGR
jgi:enoyl-CoA hydratase/carnithine racemase